MVQLNALKVLFIYLFFKSNMVQHLSQDALIESLGVSTSWFKDWNQASILLPASGSLVF